MGMIKQAEGEKHNWRKIEEKVVASLSLTRNEREKSEILIIVIENLWSFTLKKEHIHSG